MNNAKLVGKEVVEISDIREWSRSFESSENRIVKQETIAGTKVSTVFLGVNHQYGEGPNLWFETMTFRGEEGGELEDRYETFEQAEAGHAVVAQRVRETGQ